MGVSFSCPFSKYFSMANDVEEILVKSIYFENEEAKTLVRSVRFCDKDSQPAIMKSTGSGNSMALEVSVSFKTLQPETSDSICSKPEKVQSPGSVESPISDPSGPKHCAAIKLQKVYKSFRTRRKLADCAVLVQQKWWEVLDFVELNNSSVSFFDESKHETAISRWSRARTRAAKVGKGLSKNGKAKQLAMQHWLEAIDPRHRYGHNLQLYFDQWRDSQSREPFFYWLDVGEGKEVNLVDKCPRSRLQEQCIKYLGPMERKTYEVSIEGGKFFYKQTGQPLHTVGEPGHVKWIFVLSTSKTMYVGVKKKGSFQHSSFLAGGAALAAGRLVVEHGILKAAWPHSGHYRPTAENFQDFLTFLRENGVDLTDLKLCPVEGGCSLTGSRVFLRSGSSAEELTAKFDSMEIVVENSTEDGRDSEERETTPSEQGYPKPSRIQRFCEKLANLEIRKRSDFFESSDLSSPTGGYETAEDAFASGHEGNRVQNILEEPVLQMDNDNPSQESNSLQVGKQLCRKWTTGAGPRIKYVRDYPPELQVQALEQVSLSPRSSGLSRSLQSGTLLSPVKLSTIKPVTEPSSEGSIPSRPKSSLSRGVSD